MFTDSVVDAARKNYINTIFLILVCLGIVFRFIKNEVFAWLLWKNSKHRQ